ncbi:hypothetical protein [Streptomyces lydicamycinicus]|uniref:hypothetical protein n=1 Tax=Streptomyces lydicamycinicus TaxID=1546107 RepID=UPI003C2CA9B3
MNLTSEVPALFGIPVAVLTLIVAGFGLLASLVALGWQVAKHMLDGGRARVYLNAAIWEPGLRLTVNRTGKWETGTDHFEHVMPENLEVAQLVVENPGRTPITAYNPTLSIAGIGRNGRTIAPRMFKASTFGPESPKTEALVRIEPYDRVTFLLDYWSVIPSLLDGAGKSSLRIRGAVSIAGRKGLRRSSRRFAWNVPRDSFTSHKRSVEISPFTIMWREMYRMQAMWGGDEQEVDAFRLGVVLREAMFEFGELPSREDFEIALERAVDRHCMERQVPSVITWDMYRSLDRHARHLGPWPRVPRAEGPNGNSGSGEEG